MAQNKNQQGKGSGSQKKNQRQSQKPNGKPYNNRSNDRSGKRSANKEEIYYSDRAHPIRGNSSEYLGTSPNDGQWYNRVPAILNDAARIPFSILVGMKIPVKGGVAGSILNAEKRPIEMTTTYSDTIAGVMRIRYMPTIGEALDPTSPINRVATQIYTYMRSKISSKVNNYDKTSVIMMIMGVVSAYTLYNKLNRMYKVMINRDWQSKYIPEGVLKALGIAPNLRSKRVEFKSMLDQFALDLSVFCIPNNFDYISRQLWMSSGIYTDVKDPAKAQLYFTDPAGFYVYTEGVGATEPAVLEYRSFEEIAGLTPNGIINSMSEIQTAIDTLMKPLQGSSSISMITGDVIDVFGSAGLLKVQLPDTDTPLEFSYSEEFLEQIQNMTITNAKPITNSEEGYNNIVEVNTDTVAGPYLTQTIRLQGNWDLLSIGSESDAVPTHAVQLFSDYYYNTILMDPTPVDIAVGTRLSCRYTISGSAMSSPVIIPQVYGTEIVTEVDIFYNTVDNIGTITGTSSVSIDQNVLMPVYVAVSTNIPKSTLFQNSATVEHYMTQWAFIEAFKHHPMLYYSSMYLTDSVMSNTGEVVEISSPHPGTQVENLAIIDVDTLKGIHNACVISLFSMNGRIDNSQG